MVLMLDGDSEIDTHVMSSHKLDVFSLAKSLFSLYACATCSKLPTNICTMAIALATLGMWP